MKRRTRERLLEPDEVVSATELFERLEQYTATLNGADFEADFHAQSQTAEALADPGLAFRLGMESACQMTWLNESSLKHGGGWKNQVAAEEYLCSRKAETKNEMLQLRYGLLWLLTLPRGRHTGTLAQEMAAHIRAWLEQDQGRHEATENTYVELVQLGLLIGQEFRFPLDKLRHLVLVHLLDGQQSIEVRRRQLHFFSKHANLFSRADCGRLDEVSQQVYEHYKASDGYMVKLVCEAAIPLAARATNDARRWHSRKGDYIKGHAQQRHAADPTDFVVQTLMKDALDCYQAAGDKQQVLALEGLISATKHDAKLNKVEFDCTLDGPEGKLISAWMRNMPAYILEVDALVFLRLRYNLIPGRPMPAVADAEPGLADLFRHVAFDRNRNITTRQQGLGKKLLFSPYSLLMGFYRHMTFETFAQGLQSGQITYATTLEFLREQSWLGKMEFHRGQDEADAPGYTLIPWVEPALRSYFAEMERAQLDKTYEPDLMLCIDSLTVKMEGILRHFCRALDPPIATNRRARNGDQQEKTLEEIIESVESYSGPDAGYWLRYVFTKEGWNVRNNVAHGFMNPQDYSLGTMQAVILGLFVLATLHITPREAADDEEPIAEQAEDAESV